MSHKIIQGNPTVVPAENFNAKDDAQDLRKAMKGLGTDEATLIKILCKRSHEQRQEIAKAFRNEFNRDLEKDIKSEISGDFEKLVLSMFLPIAEFHAKELRDAMAGLGTDEDTLIETLCTLPNGMIIEINKIYKTIYRKDLESELKSEVSGNIKKILVTLLRGQRDESGEIDVMKAQREAENLVKAGIGKVGTDEEVFNEILCKRNYAQLDLIFSEYAKKAGHTMEKAIEKEFSGESKNALITIYRCVTDKADYFAERIYKSKGAISTKSSQLIRLVVTRCEYDLDDIKKAFAKKYKTSLKQFIKDVTKGDYERALLALINES